MSNQSVYQQKSLRWRDYVMSRGSDFDNFWQEHDANAERRLLVIVGCGFDPRAPLALRRISAAASRCKIDVLCLKYKNDASADATTLLEAVDRNSRMFAETVRGRGHISSKDVIFRNEAGRSVAARNAANLMSSIDELIGYTDVVIDISAMPRVMYFPLISRVTFFHDDLRKNGKTAPNVHVVVSEDPTLDMVIQEGELDDEASYLHPFESPFNLEASGGQHTVWIPVLGEGRTSQFERIHSLVTPTEVCPVLPSPARNPRRSDTIVMEYQQLLFDQVGLDPRNIIYGSEFNPFDVYRQVSRTIAHYHQVLSLVGGCRIAVSALCSKVMSLGVLLVAYELKGQPSEVGVAHIECQRYELPGDLTVAVETVGIWIAGECYRKE